MDLFSNPPEQKKKENPNKSEPEVIVDIDYLYMQNSIFKSTKKSNPFYDKEVLFSDKLLGNKYVEFQIIGNLGGWANDRELTLETEYYIISNSIIAEIINNPNHPIVEKLNETLNVYSQTEKKRILNYRYKKLQIISEEVFLNHVIKRCEEINDTVTMKLITKLKES